MRLNRTEHFKRSYKQMPKFVQKKSERILVLLAADLRHPSIRAKKIQEQTISGKGELINFTDSLLKLRTMR